MTYGIKKFPISTNGKTILSGTHAARPGAFSVQPGYLYYETDTTHLFFSDGATWTQIT